MAPYKLSPMREKEIAEAYQRATRRELRTYVFAPALRAHFGDLSGKHVLDLACGEGWTSRLARDHRAARVIGVDIAGHGIELARDIEEELLYEGKIMSPIRYYIRDAFSPLDDLGAFDVISAVMTLNYCSSKGQLYEAARNARRMLSESGVFLALIPNPALARDYDGYGVRMRADSEAEGAPYSVTLRDFSGTEFCSFQNYFWKTDTYLDALRTAGFSGEFLAALPSPDAHSLYGDAFWEEYKKQPIYLIFVGKPVA